VATRAGAVGTLEQIGAEADRALYEAKTAARGSKAVAAAPAP
jgi:hypothetical protein